MPRDIRRFARGGAATILLIALLGGAYALGRSDSGDEPEPDLQVVQDTPTSVPSPRATATPAPLAPSPIASSSTAAPEVVQPRTALVPTNTPVAAEAPTGVTPPGPANTATPEPPTHAFRYGVVEGTGDDVLIVGPGPALLRITGNAQSRHFAVSGRDATGNSTGLLVNTTDPYSGIVALDFYEDEATARVEITATGRWTVEVLPLSAARVINAPGFLAGEGDEVLLISGTPDIAKIIGNEDSYHFAVVSYGDFADLLVNTTDPYNDKVAVSPDATLLEIDAVGQWTVRFQ